MQFLSTYSTYGKLSLFVSSSCGTEAVILHWSCSADMKTARITWTLEHLQLVTSVPYLSARENFHQSESVIKRFLKEHFHKVAKKQHLGRTHQKRAVFLTGRAHKKMHSPLTVRNCRYLEKNRLWNRTLQFYSVLVEKNHVKFRCHLWLYWSLTGTYNYNFALRSTKVTLDTWRRNKL